jgi:hypothetical protein
VNAARATFALAAVLAGVLVWHRSCAGRGVQLVEAALEAGLTPASSPASTASQASQASQAASTASRAEASEAAKLRTRTRDQGPTTARSRRQTTFYRPNGVIDHVTIDEREVSRGRLHEAEAEAEASRSASTASEASSSSSTSTRSTTSTASTRPTWSILWGAELAPARKPFGVAGLELRLVGPVWATSWGAPGDGEAGAGLRLDLGRLTLGFAPRVLPTPQLGGLASATLQLVGPFQVAAWGRATSSSAAAGAGLRVAW